MQHPRRTLLVTVSTLVLPLALTACGGGTTGGTNAGTKGAAATGTATAGTLPDSCKSGSPILGVSLPDTTNPYYVAMQKGFVETGKAKGFDVKVAIANDDDSTQLSQVESFIQQKVCAVALNPVSSGPSAAIVKDLNKAGIPVFTVNVLVSQTDLEKQGGSVIQFVGADQAQGGQVEAEQAIKDLGSKSIIVGIVGFPDSVTTNQRDEGFKKALGSKGSVKTTVNGKVDPNISLQVTTDMLQGNPDMTVVYGDTGPATFGAVQAVKQLGLSDKVSVYGFCAADTALAGPYKGCTAQEPYDYAKIVVENVRTFLDGGKIPATILRPLKTFVTGQKPGPGLLG